MFVFWNHCSYKTSYELDFAHRTFPQSCEKDMKSRPERRCVMFENAVFITFTPFFLSFLCLVDIKIYTGNKDKEPSSNEGKPGAEEAAWGAGFSLSCDEGSGKGSTPGTRWTPLSCWWMLSRSPRLPAGFCHRTGSLACSYGTEMRRGQRWESITAPKARISPHCTSSRSFTLSDVIMTQVWWLEEKGRRKGRKE